MFSKKINPGSAEQGLNGNLKAITRAVILLGGSNVSRSAENMNK